jgi:hypothetical protein
MAIKLLLGGGLGNQLFQYAAAKSLSLKLDTELIVDLRFYSNAVPNSDKSPWLLDYPLRALISDQRKFMIGPHNIARRVVRRLISERPRYRYVQPKFHCDDAFWSLSDGATLSGEFQSLYYFEDWWSEIKTDFFVDQTSKFRPRSHFKDIPLTDLVAVHVRRGDYLGIDGFYMKNLEEYYTRAMDVLGVGVRQLLVFSDDLEWCRKQPIFLGAMFFDEPSLAPYEDLHAMAACRDLIIANSSFSWWAGWLAFQRGAQIVAPTDWILGHSSEELGLIPKGWHVVG